MKKKKYFFLIIFNKLMKKLSTTAINFLKKKKNRFTICFDTSSLRFFLIRFLFTYLKGSEGQKQWR